MRCRRLGIALTVSCLVGGAGATQLKLAGSAISANSTMKSECYRLIATIGEPSAGYAASADYSLLSGLLAAQDITDQIFGNGFEDCSTP